MLFNNYYPLLLICCLAFQFMLPYGSAQEVIDGRPTLISPKKVVYEFEGTKANSGQCQSCLSLYKQADGKDDGYFRFVLAEAIELNSTGLPCCTGGSSAGCPYATECNNHVHDTFPSTFTFQLGDDHCDFQGTVSSQFGGGSNCVPPGTSSFICAAYDFNYTVSADAQDYSFGGDTFPVLADALIGYIRVRSWPFYSTSTGFRLKFQLMTRNAVAVAIRLQPKGEEVTEPMTLSKPDYTGATLRNDYKHDAGVTLSFGARVDGVDTPVTISGPYPHKFDDSSKYFYVDFPKFTTSLEYVYTAYIPEISDPTLDTGKDADAKDGSTDYKTLAIVLGVVFGVCCLCIVLVVIIIKLR